MRGLALWSLTLAVGALAAPQLRQRNSVTPTPLSANQIASYILPDALFARAAAATPNTTITWSCGGQPDVSMAVVLALSECAHPLLLSGL